jgi:replicative DNA helicase
MNDPDQTITAEKSVICAMMQTPNQAISEAQDLGLRPDHFSFPACRTMFSELIEMHDKAIPIELPSVTVRLAERNLLENCGGGAGVSGIYTAGWTGNLTFYAKTVTNAWATRQAVAACNESIDTILTTPDALQANLDALRTKIDSIIIGAEQSSEPASQIGKVLGDVVQDLQNRMDGKDIAEIPCPWSKIRVGRGSLVVVGARPGMGKTAFILNWLEFLATQSEPSCLISLEMGETELGYRTLASQSKVPIGSYSNEDLKSGALTRGNLAEIVKSTTKFKDAPLYLKQIPGGHRGDVCQAMRTAHRRYGIKVFALDYLQLIEPLNKEEGISDKRRIDSALRAINATRKQLGATLIVAAQIDRQADDRPAAEMPMGFLSDTSQTEKDADTIIFLGERTEEQERFWSGDESTTAPRAAAMKKQRGRGTGVVNMEFQRNTTTWRQT